VWLPKGYWGDRLGAALSQLLGGLVEDTSQIGQKRGAGFFVFQATDKNHQNERPRSKDKRRIVVDFGDFPGFVSDTSVRWESGGNAFVEMLALEDLDHLLGMACVGSLIFGD
jgi:hypothetical protein